MANIIRNRAGIDKRIYDAVRFLSDMDPDRASTRNGAGWNGSDGEWGHAIAEKPFEFWTLRMGQLAYKMIRKYSGQLRAAGIEYSDISAPNDATITLEEDALIFRSPRDHAAVALVRSLPHRRWTGADGTPQFCWRIAIDQKNLDGLRDLYRSGTVEFSTEAITALKALSAPQAQPQQTEEAQPPLPSCAPQEAAEARSQGLVRVSYGLDEQNRPVFRLRHTPSLRFLQGTYETAREAQRAADLLNHGPELS